MSNKTVELMLFANRSSIDKPCKDEPCKIEAARRIAVCKAICAAHWKTATDRYIYLPVDLQLIYMSERLNHVNH